MRREFIIACIMALFVGANIPSALVYAENSQSTEHKILYVDDDYNETTPGYGEFRFSKIQDAINKAPDGCKIIVFSGVYQEDIGIKKRIILLGENKYTTIIRSTSTDHAIKIAADSVMIDGFKIEGSSEVGMRETNYGIEIDRCNNTDIRNCIICNFDKAGIYVYGGDLITISRCKIIDNGAGILVSKDVPGNVDMITLCNISNNWGNAIELEGARVSTIERNVITNNGGYAVYIKTATGTATGQFFIHRNHVEDNSKGVICTPDDNPFMMGMYLQENNFVNNRNENEIRIVISSQSLFLWPIVYFKKNYWEGGRSVHIRWHGLILLEKIGKWEFVQAISPGLWWPNPSSSPNPKPDVDP